MRGFFLESVNSNGKGAYFLGALFESAVSEMHWRAPIFIGRAVLKRKRLVLRNAQIHTEKRWFFILSGISVRINVFKNIVMLSVKSS